MNIPFKKLSGAGNDFIVIDNRHNSIEFSTETIKALCTRRTGIGADGLILIEASQSADFTMKYYNSDGLLGSMCGNGGRCAAYFAYNSGVPTQKPNEYLFEANGNYYHAWIVGKEQVKLQMNPSHDFKENLQVEGLLCYFLNTGSPHVVTYVDDVNIINVYEKGDAIRHRTDIFNGGTNVNFVQQTSANELIIRTFERGVEDETLACGTGAVASALISHMLGKTNSTSLNVTVRSGDTLQISFTSDMENIYLSGPTKIIFSGTFEKTSSYA